MKKLYSCNKEIINYVIVGGLTTVISLLSYFVFSEFLSINFNISNVLSWILSIIFAFFANKHFVFQSKKNKIKSEFLEFLCSRIITLGIDLLLMNIIVNLLSFNNMLAKLIVQIIIIVLNYLFGSLIFKQNKEFNLTQNFIDFIKNNKVFLIIFFVACYLILPYVSEYIIAGHDIEYHMTNINGIIESINSGNLFATKVLNNSINNFGYGASIFYSTFLYNVVAYISVIFQIGSIGSVKLLFFLVIFTSGVSMYCFTNSVFKNKYAALISAIFYITSAYLYSDIFIRFALSEVGIFIFAPITLLGTYKLINENKKLILIIGATGMIYSHLVMTMYLILFIAIYLIINYKLVLKKQVIKNIIVSGVMIILLTLPFTVPMFEHKIYTDYAVFQDGHMNYNIEDIGEVRGLSIFRFTLNTNESDIVYQLQPAVIVLLLVSVIYFSKFQFLKKQKIIFWFLVTITGLSVILSLNIVNWTYLPSVLAYIQFPWRLVLYVTMGTSVLASLSIIMIEKKYQKFSVIILLIGSLYFYNDIFYYAKLEDVDSELIETFADLGNQKEYLPVTAYDNLDYYMNRDDSILLVSGYADIVIISDETPNLSATFENVENDIIIELPRTFYLGYTITYITDYSEITLSYYENDYGFIELEIPNEDGILVLEYEGTTANHIANCVCIMTLIISGSYMFYKNYKIKYNYKKKK